MEQLVLQFANLLLGGADLAEVPDDADVLPAVVLVDLTDGQLHWKHLAIAAAPRFLSALADDPGLPGTRVTLQIAVVLASVRLRHQHPHIAADHLIRVIAEHALRRPAESLNLTVFIDDDDGIHRGVHQRL